MLSSSPPQALDRVRVTLPDLIRLSRSAAGLSLKQSGIRAAQGGNYLSSFKGRGMEFDETRPYTPGDDVRNLDWRVTARTGKVHTKMFREERERPVFLSVDVRRPMFFATRGVFKSVLAAQLAALVAWSALRHGDRVGGQLFGDAGSLELKPDHGRAAVLRLLQRLADMAPVDRPSPVAALDDALARLLHHARPGSLVFVFSDFRGLGPAGESCLARLSRHCDLALCFISDPLEQVLPTAGRYRFGDGERELALDASSAAAAAHAARFERRREHVEALARQHRLRFIPCRTVDDPYAVLRGSLQQRRPVG